MRKAKRLETPVAKALREKLKDHSLGDADIYADSVDAFVVIHYDLTFEDLSIISEVFGGTKKIDVGTETHQGGYCDTCAYSYSVAVIKVHGKASQLLAE